MHKYFKIIFILFKYYIFIHMIKIKLFIYNTIYRASADQHALQHIKDIKIS